MFERFDSANDFLKAARDFLEADEAAHSLILGIAEHVAQKPDVASQGAERPFFALASENGAPILVAVMTPPHKLVLSPTTEIPSWVVEKLVKELRSGKWAVSGMMASPATSRAFAARWAESTGAQAREGMHTRVHQLFAVNYPQDPPGAFRPGVPADLELLTGWWMSFNTEAKSNPPEVETTARETVRARIESGSLFVWDDGGPVSMALQTRPTRNSMSIGGVYTPPDKRYRGYATSCVAHLSQHILDSGKKLCCLFTDLANPTSNSIYAKIGYRAVCEYQDIHFGN